MIKKSIVIFICIICVLLVFYIFLITNRDQIREIL